MSLLLSLLLPPSHRLQWMFQSVSWLDHPGSYFTNSNENVGVLFGACVELLVSCQFCMCSITSVKKTGCLNSYLLGPCPSAAALPLSLVPHPPDLCLSPPTLLCHRPCLHETLTHMTTGGKVTTKRLLLCPEGRKQTKNCFGNHTIIFPTQMFPISPGQMEKMELYVPLPLCAPSGCAVSHMHSRIMKYFG